ncbi:MAG: hypothetical protein GF383_07605 [Candidatus Lokiarchaeota archaeon]|nr:hypothetical protein [Candidatus Lokiarchaeota archaeon]MBD3340116.1 hypothetical protein [Candidatus Lokiarchaeota archaeon]
MDYKEILDKCKLTENEMKAFLKHSEKMDPKKDHKMAYRTLMNPTRRSVLKGIGFNVKTTQELINELNIEEDQLNYHLSMLEQLHFIMDCQDGWKSTPRGIGFLTNATVEF